MSKLFPNNELDNLSIQQLVFHVAKKGTDTPIYLDEVTLEEAHYDFFEDLIRLAISKSAPFNFQEEENENVLLLIDMVEDTTASFFANARKLAANYQAVHANSLRDGMLLFALLDIGSAAQKMLFFAKIDHLEVLRYQLETVEDQQKAILQHIQQAIVQNEDAILKSALIDLDATFEWDVAAQDRQKGGQDIADYFKQFLHVQEKEINAILSTKVVAEVQRWAEKNKEDVLLPAEHIADYKERAVSYLRTAPEFDTHELMDIVIPETDNPERRQDLSQSLYQHLERKDLTEQHFVPEPENIKSSVSRNRIQTKEGVQIFWEGNMETHGVEIKEENGQIQIIIRTEDYTFK